MPDGIIQRKKLESDALARAAEATCAPAGTLPAIVLAHDETGLKSLRPANFRTPALPQAWLKNWEPLQYSQQWPDPKDRREIANYITNDMPDNHLLLIVELSPDVCPLALSKLAMPVTSTQRMDAQTNQAANTKTFLLIRIAQQDLPTWEAYLPPQPRLGQTPRPTYDMGGPR